MYLHGKILYKMYMVILSTSKTERKRQIYKWEEEDCQLDTSSLP